MSIQELTRKFKDFLINTDVVLILIVITTAILSFLLGRESVTPSTPITQKSLETNITSELLDSPTPTSSSTSIPTLENTQYVASKSGTKYHLPWCAGAKQIKEENKIFFNSKEEAELAGYAPASNCKGI